MKKKMADGGVAQNASLSMAQRKAMRDERMKERMARRAERMEQRKNRPPREPMTPERKAEMMNKFKSRMGSMSNRMGPVGGLIGGILGGLANRRMPAKPVNTGPTNVAPAVIQNTLKPAMRGGGLAKKGVGQAMAKGGMVKANGCAKRGKTRGKMV